MRYRYDMDECSAFYSEHKGKLFYYLMRLTGDYHLSCDILQESFIRYFTRYHDRGRNLSLLYTIAKNLFRDSLRRGKKDALLEDNQEEHAANQEERLIISEEYQRVVRAIQKLKDDEREILSLLLSEEFSYREIAEIVKTSEANVKVKVHRARVRLKEILRGGDL
jgi:RNA polymerase sigma factor (sigma-70 family)